MRQIVEQAHKPPDETEIKTLQTSARREKDERLKMQCEQVRESLPGKAERAVELALEKGASNWLTVIPVKEMNFNLNKREFRDAIKVTEHSYGLFEYLYFNTALLLSASS